MPEKGTNLPESIGTLVGFDPAVDADKLNWSDPDTHAAILGQLSYYLDEADAFRSKAVEDILRLARYQANMYLKSTDTTSTEAKNQQALAEKKAREKGKGRYFSVPILNGQSERTKALWGAVALDFECARMTTCDDDLTISEFYAHLCNRFIKQRIDEVKVFYVDKLKWEFRPILKTEWDRSGGVLAGKPVMTDDKFTKYKKRKVQNKRMPNGGFWRRDENEVLMSERPVPTGTPVFAPLGPLEYLMDPAAGWRGVRGARYFADQRIVDASEVFERWANDDTEMGKKIQKLLLDWTWGKRLVISSAEETIWGYRDISTESSTPTKAVLTEMFLRPRQHLGLTQGAHVLFITGEGAEEGMSGEGIILKYEPLRWPFDIPASDDGMEIVDSHYYYGNNTNNLAGGLARGMNQMFSHSIKNAGRLSKTVAYASGVDMADGAKVDIKQIGPDDTLVIIPGDQSKIESVQQGGSAALVQSSFFDQFMSAISLSTNSSPGAMPSNELATIANRSLMYEASVANAVKERMTTAILRAVSLGARMCQRFFSVEDFQAILKDKDATEVILFRDADLTNNTNIKLRSASFFAGNMEARLSVVAMAAQGKDLFREFVDPEQLSELLRFRDELGPTSTDREVERAEKENAMLRRGPIRRVTTKAEVEAMPLEGVMETDNHVIHVPVHLKPLADPNRESLSVGFIERLLGHVKVHMKSIQAAKMQQMSDAILAEKLAAQKFDALGGAPQPPAGQGAPGAQRGQGQ